MQKWIQRIDSFRQSEKTHIMSVIEPGTVVQVCGPPMVGKSTLVYQVVKDMSALKQRQITCHHILCRNLDSMVDVFITIMAVLTNDQFGRDDDERSFTMDDILLTVQSIVSQRSDRSHVFIFHKCEGLNSPQRHLRFLTLLTGLADLKVGVVMTTYKKFQISGRHTKCVEIGMLTDPIDIHCLLQRHAPGVNVMDYVYVCQTALCLPEAVIQLSQRYLSDRDNVQSLRLLQSRYPGSLEEIISWDAEFYCRLFNARIDDVKSWVTQKDIDLLACQGQSSFTEGQLWASFRSLYPYESPTAWFFRLTKLKDNYVIREVPGTDQLAVHPLIVYYIHKHWPRVRMHFTEEDVSGSRNFMCHVIIKTEENMRKNGRKGQLYGCHAQEWPVIQDLLKTAIHCRSYTSLLKVAVMGRNLITSCYPNESRQFYSTLYHVAKMIGSPSQAGVMEVCLAQAIVSSKDIDWSQALSHLDSAITTLKRPGPDFFYKTALRKKAQALEKLGDHVQSLEFFKKAKQEVGCQGFLETDETLHVTDLQKEEDNIASEIQEIIPLIFTGNNTVAKEKLMELFHDIPERYENHPDYAVVLNGIGLTIQRGTKDMNEAFFWYNKSYQERKHLERICPQSMLATMNNMAMILCRKGNPDEGEKYLLKSLAILRETGWYQYYTALTLTHLSEVKVKQNDFQAAFDVTLQADHIIQRTTQNHDFRLKINMSLVHHRLVLNQGQSTASTSVEDYIDKLIDLGGQSKNYLSDDGHHYLMSAYEHSLFLHLQNSEDRFNHYKRNLFAHVVENQFLNDVLLRKNLTKSPSSLLSEHREFLEYLKNPQYEHYSYETFLSFLLRSCPMCRNIRDVSDISVWSKELGHLNEVRLKRLKDIKAEFPLLSNLTPISSNSFEKINSTDISSLDQNCQLYGHPSVEVSDRKLTNLSFIDRVENVSSPLVNNPSVINDKNEKLSSPHVNNPSDIDDKNEKLSSPHVNNPSVIDDKNEKLSSPHVNNPSVIDDKNEKLSSPHVNNPSVINDKDENVSTPHENNPVIDPNENLSSPQVNNPSVNDDKNDIFSSPYMNNPSDIKNVENISSHLVNNPSDIKNVENISSHLVNSPSSINQTENCSSRQVKNPSIVNETRDGLPKTVMDTSTTDISWEVLDPSDDDSISRSIHLDVLNYRDVNEDLSHSNILEGSPENVMGELAHSYVPTFNCSPQTSDFSDLLPPVLLRQLTEEGGVSVFSDNNFNNSEGFDFCDPGEPFSSPPIDNSDNMCPFVPEISRTYDEAVDTHEHGETYLERGDDMVTQAAYRPLTTLTHISNAYTHPDVNEGNTMCNILPSSARLSSSDARDDT